MLTVGTNTYLTAAQAGEFLQEEPDGKQWDTLSEQQKEAALLEAARHIEALQYAGHKHTVFQAMAFPRDMNRQVPMAIRRAQALEALAVAVAREQDDRPPERQAAVRSMEAAGLLLSYFRGNAPSREMVV